jgi:hypothetical protein
VNSTTDVCTAVDERVAALVDLVRWLALPYDRNMPLFTVADWNGEPLTDGERLRRLYVEVMGPDLRPVGSFVSWSCCPTCAMWQTIPVSP